VKNIEKKAILLKIVKNFILTLSDTVSLSNNAQYKVEFVVVPEIQTVDSKVFFIF
jgi:hypothetical protein